MLRQQILLLGNKKMFLPQVKNIFASRTQNLLPQHMFPSLASTETMLTSFQCCSLKMFPSNGEHRKMADGEVEVEEAQAGNRKGKGKKERNWKDEEIELLITLFEDRACLWDVADEGYMNRDKKELAHCQIDLQMSEKYGITREDYKSKWKILRSQFMREQALERKKKSGQPTSDVYHSSWKWYKMLKFLIIVHNATKGFDTMKITLPEDHENESPGITPTKKTKEDFDRKRMSVLDRAVGILKEVNEAPTTTAELSEEDAFGMVVARTLARLGPRERMLTKKKINDILFEAEFHVSEHTTGHMELSSQLSSYNPMYVAPVARAAEQYFSNQFSTL